MPHVVLYCKCLSLTSIIMSDIYVNSVVDKKIINPFVNNFHKAKERSITSLKISEKSHFNHNVVILVSSF